MKSLALVLGMFLTGLGLASVIAMNPPLSSQKKDEPTQVQVGVMTEKQRAHSKLFETYHSGRKLDVPLPDTTGLGKKTAAAEETVYLEVGITVTSPEVPIPTFTDSVKDLACTADAIVLARAKNRTSQLTANKEFVFSDYVLTVEQVLKDNSVSSITPMSDITVTRPGGKVRIDERVVKVFVAAYKPFEMDEQYLLFLQYLPETGAYKSIMKGSFRIEDDVLVLLTEEAVPGGSGDTRPFTAEVRGVLNAGCDKKR